VDRRAATRRPSKRQKDLMDIMRLVEAHPKLCRKPPADVAKRISQAQNARQPPAAQFRVEIILPAQG
jgi:hypothetical protein